MDPLAAPALSRRALLLAPLLLGARAAGAAEDRAKAAEALIERLAREAVAIVARRDLDLEGKLSRLERLLEEATDLDLIARLIMGRYWRLASPEQRRRFIALFRALLRRSMARRLERYSGETLEVTGSVPLNGGGRDIIVRSRVRRPGGRPPYAVDWVVRQRDGRFLIIDVIVEGVSMLVEQRAEVAAIAGRRGIDGLLAELERRLEEPEGAPRARG